MDANKIVDQMLSEEAVPTGAVWVIRVDGSETNRPDYYGPFDNQAAADAAVEEIPQFENTGQPHNYDYDSGSATVDIVTGYLPPGDKGLKRLKPAANFKTDWAWLNDI
jgi:hypothetical protein